MGLVFRFTHDRDIRMQIPGCPLQTTPPADDEAACSTCRFNVVNSGQPRIGCIAQLSATTVDAALESLSGYSPALRQRYDELFEASRNHGVDPTAARKWLALASGWHASLNRDAKRHEEMQVTVAIARFAKAALDLGEPVELLE